MSALSDRDHIFEALRGGLVPETGLDSFAIGVEAERAEIGRQLELVQGGQGSTKFLRGGYGCGKTFMARLAVLDARARGFATSFVVVSDNDLRFHRFDDVYRKVVSELGTARCPRGALGDVLDRWIAQVEDKLIDAGADEDAPDFDRQVSARLDQELARLTGGKAPADFVRVVQTIFQLKQEGRLADAGALLSWLSGSGNVAASAKRLAGIKGDIGSRDAMDYLRGLVEIVKEAGHPGLLIVIDEAETILRMRKDVRHKSLNGIRQIADAAGSFPGLLWLFTGTPEFFDARRGVAGLEPLHARIGFLDSGRFTNRRQPQLALRPFDAERLERVGVRLAEIFPAKNPERVSERLDAVFIRRLVEEVTTGFGGDVGIVPRQFLRELVNQLDITDDHADYFPARQYGFAAGEMSPEEQTRLSTSPTQDDDVDDLIPAEDSW